MSKKRGARRHETTTTDENMNSLSALAEKVASTVFSSGRFKVELKSVEEGTGNRRCSPFPAPPKPLLIGFPVEAGDFPVLLFLHGYLLLNSFYTQLIQHIASHGYIVVAPQLYNVAGPDATEEIKAAAATTNWLVKELQCVLPPGVLANLTKFGIAGHSRGGKTSFALASAKAAMDLKCSVLIGVDPVDGMCPRRQTPPPVLTYVPRSFDIDMPVMVIGSGLGEFRTNPLFPPCAPKGVSHEAFFSECKKPACYFVVKDYGHTDMLDDDTKGIRGKATYCLCKNGKSREPMRRFVGGIVVAFLRAYLDGDTADLNAVRKGDTGPVELQTMEFLV